MDDVLSVYKDPEILNKKLNVTFLGEIGQDMGGLTKELFCLFWQLSEERFFKGEDVIVPYIPLHKKRSEKGNLEVLGRVLTHMAILTKTVPTKISRSVFSVLADRQIQKNDVLNDFLSVSTEEERGIIKMGLTNFYGLNKNQLEFLQTFFTSNDLYEVPKKNDFREQILTIAEDVLVEKPRELILAMRNGIPFDLLMTVWRPLTREALCVLLQKEAATVDNVVNVITTEENLDLSNKEEKTLHFLKSYIYSLKENRDLLTTFLIFVTGSANAPRNLKVTFNDLSSSLRRPIVHTCSNVLELSTSYNTFQEFKKEMTLYLRSEYSLQYSQI